MNIDVRIDLECMVLKRTNLLMICMIHSFIQSGVAGCRMSLFEIGNCEMDRTFGT
jgi:hypothetical protein